MHCLRNVSSQVFEFLHQSHSNCFCMRSINTSIYKHTLIFGFMGISVLLFSTKFIKVLKWSEIVLEEWKSIMHVNNTIQLHYHYEETMDWRYANYKHFSHVVSTHSVMSKCLKIDVVLLPSAWALLDCFLSFLFEDWHLSSVRSVSLLTAQSSSI